MRDAASSRRTPRTILSALSSIVLSSIVLSSIVLSSVVLSSCKSYVVIPDADREHIEDARTGQLLYLKQSMYAGRFYDDDRYRLLHPRRFEELTYLQTAEGDAIPPPPAEEIIPAGTRVRVERIEWPDGDAVFRRPLFTPRYTTWIFLRVARERGSDVTVERDERHILLLPGGITDGATFDAWFASAAGTADPNPWLLGLPSEQQSAIALKRPAVGMEREALMAAMGMPDRLERDDTSEVAVYGAASVVLRDGRVVRFSVPGLAQPPATATPSGIPSTPPPETTAPTSAPTPAPASSPAEAPPVDTPPVAQPPVAPPPVDTPPVDTPAPAGDSPPPPTADESPSP